MRGRRRQIVFGADGKADDISGVGLHPYSVFEFEGTMPQDDVRITSNAAADSVNTVRQGARWSPIDCQLVSDFVAVP